MRPWLVVAVVCPLLVGCAEGTPIDNPAGGGGSSASGGGFGGSGGEGGARGPSSTSSPSSATSGSATSASSSSSGGGEGGASSSSASSSSGGEVCDFTSSNVCATAETLGSIAGDESSATLTVQGLTSKWFAVRVEERVSGISGADLSYRVSLTSPAGMNYDLFVYQGPQDGVADCGAPPIQGSVQGGAEVVSASWNDDQGIGGEDDSLWLSIEVRYVSGEACTLADLWTLTIEGDV